MFRTSTLGRPSAVGFQEPARMLGRRSIVATLRPRRRQSVGGVVALPSVEVGGADGRALSFMRAAASARVTGGGAVGGVAAGGGAEGPARAGGGAKGPALSRKKYGETPDLTCC